MDKVSFDIGIDVTVDEDEYGPWFEAYVAATDETICAGNVRDLFRQIGESLAEGVLLWSRTSMAGGTVPVNQVGLHLIESAMS